jgi:hypothetical protein
MVEASRSGNKQRRLDLKEEASDLERRVVAAKT